jgi:hypothetical protein
MVFNYPICNRLSRKRVTLKIIPAFSIILFSFLLLPGKSLAGNEPDSVAATAKKAENDSITSAARKRANKMAIMSAVVPGLGQIGNKKYWKLPILYGAGGVLYYFIRTNDSEYHKFRKALLYRTDNDSLTVDDYPRFTNDDLTVRKNYYRRNRDLSYIFAGVLYTLNIIDAYVDSQLMNFDVGDNLTLHTMPALNFSPGLQPVASVSLILRFK